MEHLGIYTSHMSNIYILYIYIFFFSILITHYILIITHYYIPSFPIGMTFKPTLLAALRRCGRRLVPEALLSRAERPEVLGRLGHHVAPGAS